MSPIFYCILTWDLDKLEELINLGVKSGEIKFLITSTCNGMPPAYYCLLKMQQLLV